MFGNVQPGDIKYKDQNNDGVINDFDKVMIGGDKPLSYFGIDLGFEWRGLEFSMFWQGVYNKDVLMSDWNLLEGFQTQGQVYGQAYENICHRILGEEVAFLDLDAKQGVFSKLKDLFKKN